MSPGTKNAGVFLLNNRIIRVMYCVIWALASVMLFPLFVSDDSIHFSNSGFSVLMFIGNFALLDSESKRERSIRLFVCSHVLGLLLSTMVAFGYSLDQYGSIHVIRLAFSIIVFSHVFADLLSFLWHSLLRIEEELNNASGKVQRSCDNAFSWLTKRPYVVLLILLLLWLPAFLADYPGGFRYDAGKELNQVINGYSGEFPLLHSAIITTLLPLGYKLTGSYNTGIAVYVAIQMIIAAAIYTHMICVFSKRRVNSTILLLIILYCGLFPVIQILVVQEVRDVLFGILLMYSVFLLFLLETDKEYILGNLGRAILLAAIIVLTILSRSNNAGVFAYIILILFALVIWLVNRKKFFVGATVFSVSCIILFFVFSTVLNLICQPFTPANKTASLALVSQSLARTYLDNQFSPEEKEEFSSYMDMNDLVYVPENADSTRSGLRNPTGKTSDFILYWIKTGMKYPGSYLDAILANTQNMWFPPSVIDGYNQRYKDEGQPYSQWDKCYYAITDTLNEPAEHKNYLPALSNFYTQIGLKISFEKIPVISMLFSIGFQYWVLLNCLFYNVFRRKRKLMLPLCVLLLYMLVSALAPLILLRYFAAVFFCVPIMLVFTLQPSAACMHGEEDHCYQTL